MKTHEFFLHFVLTSHPLFPIKNHNGRLTDELVSVVQIRKKRNTKTWEAATRGVLRKMLFLKISQYSRENTCVESFFNKFTDLLFLQLFKNRLQHNCFLVNIAIISRIHILKNICERLLLKFYIWTILIHFYSMFSFISVLSSILQGYQKRIQNPVKHCK